MIDFSETYIFGDQPVTCPKCGARTDFFFQSAPIPNEKVQIHICLSNDCQFEFVVEINDENE